MCVPDRSHLPPEVVAKSTVVCFPGFLEDMRYFLEVHHNTPARLIILNNANYQNPFALDPGKQPAWCAPNPYPVGTIGHDAFCLNQVLDNMTNDERVVVHGHSRGGAVVLEAGNQQPEKAKRREAILEAAVVPQGRLADNRELMLQPVGYYVLPVVLAILRFTPPSLRLRTSMTSMSSSLKKKLIAAIPFTPKQYGVATTSVKDLVSWQENATYQSYNRHKKTSLFVAEREKVLNRAAMVRSALQCPAVDIIETTDTDHFISLETPDRIREYFDNGKFHPQE